MPPSETTARQPPTAATRSQTAEPDNLPCPRCDATNTKFCYYNNYNLSQPRYFCKACRRYWTRGGSLRNVPVGGGSRKNHHPSKRPRSAAPTTTATPLQPPPPSSLPALPVNTTSFYQPPNEDDNHLMMSLNTNSFMSLLTANAAGPDIGLGYGLGFGPGGSDGGGMMMMMDGGDCVMGMGWLGSEQMTTVGMPPPGKTGVKLETDYYC